MTKSINEVYDQYGPQIVSNQMQLMDKINKMSGEDKEKGSIALQFALPLLLAAGGAYTMYKGIPKLVNLMDKSKPTRFMVDRDVMSLLESAQKDLPFQTQRFLKGDLYKVSAFDLDIELKKAKKYGDWAEKYYRQYLEDVKYSKDFQKGKIKLGDPIRPNGPGYGTFEDFFESMD